MKIGVLNTDKLKPEFSLRFGEYPSMFARLFLIAKPDLKLQTYNVLDFQYPKNIEECDAYLITGSKLSVYEEIPWIIELKNFVKRLNASQKKIVGICFGHQLIAEALGGKTLAAEAGWCVGAHKTKLNENATFYKTSGEEFWLLSNHRDQVSKMAEGATLLASTEACPIAMTSLGDHILTFQGHPEFDKEYAKALLDMRREILVEPVYAAAIKSLEIPTNNSLVSDWIIRFIER